MTYDEIDRLVDLIRGSSTYDYPNNLLTKEETRLCIENIDRIIQVEESLAHSAYGDPAWVFAKVKIAAEYYGLKYTMPGIGKARYDELKIATYSAPRRFLASIFR